MLIVVQFLSVYWISTLTRVGCYIWYSEEGSGGWGPTQSPPRCTKCNSHPSTASVPTSYYLMWQYNCLWNRRRRFWHSTHDCVAPYVDIILHRGRFWTKAAASGSIRWYCFRSCWTVLSHVMWGRPSCLLQSAREEANRILLASALSSMRIICPNRVSWCDWIIALSLGCFVSLRTSLFRTNWYYLMSSSIRRHH